MLWPLDHLLARSSLDGLPGIHDKRILGKVAGTGDIMRYEEQGKSLLVFEAQRKVQHIETDRDIQNGDGSVSHQHLWSRGQGTRNSHTLALPAAQLMRVLRDELLGRTQADAIEQSQHLFPLFSRIVYMTMQPQWSTQVIADVMHRVERGEWVLEDYLHMAPISAQVGSSLDIDRLTPEFDRASRRLVEPRQHASHRGFATTAFSNQCQGATRREGQRGILNCMHRRLRTEQLELAQRKILAQMHSLQDGRCSRRARPL